MVLELMGVRLMGPHFGQSQIVWTNVIGVVLASMALGQWWGGRLAESGAAGRVVIALLLAGVFAAVLPELIPWMASLSMPGDLRLDEAAPFVTRGSLLVALLALGLPLFALGVVTPCLVRLSRGVEAHPGAVTGRLLGLGTLGSLVGTFGATHVLLPSIGSAAAMRTGAGLLIVAACVLWGAGLRARRRAAALCLLPLLAVVLPAPELIGDVTVLEARDTSYQYVRVLENAEGRRWLALNEGLDSFHSVWTPGELLTGDYYDAFLLPALLAASTSSGNSGSVSERPREVLVIGLAAGTMARQLQALDPEAAITGVELDPSLIEIGERWFGLPENVETLGGVDGRVVLEQSRRQWGSILVDAFSSQIYVPPQLASVEAFEALRQRLVPGGWVALNLSARGIEDPVAHAVIGSFARVFPGAGFLRVPGTRNLFVLGRRGGLSERPPAAATLTLSGAGLLPALSWLLDPGAWAAAPQLSPTGVLRDGLAPLEELAHRSWVGEWVAQASPNSPARTVRVSPTRQLEMARAALRRTEWTLAASILEAPASSMMTPSELAQRDLLLGNIAFERSEWREAHAAYSAVLAHATGDGAVESAARQNLQYVTDSERLAGQRKREAARLTWILGAVATLTLLAWVGMWRRAAT
ncbi:MAG: hypothetical protein DHS20C15_01160 [Planctomycetota bacterium]|nr:MAG: hypothetical protein DHS20C15_01160 [Planctomycetota bacterium]